MGYLIVDPNKPKCSRANEQKFLFNHQNSVMISQTIPSLDLFYRPRTLWMKGRPTPPENVLYWQKVMWLIFLTAYECQWQAFLCRYLLSFWQTAFGLIWDLGRKWTPCHGLPNFQDTWATYHMVADPASHKPGHAQQHSSISWKRHIWEQVQAGMKA